MIAALRYSPTGRGAKPLVAIAVAGVATLLLLLAAMMPPRLKGDLESASIALDAGSAYLVRVPLKPPIGLRVIGDGGAGGSSAQLQLFEDGKPLGPGHAAHTAIRTEGHGRYSHWGPNLWFSSSDSSDPRSNGRRYSIEATASIHPAAAIGIVLLDAMVLIFAWPWLQANERSRRWLVYGGFAIALILAALLAMGAFGRVNSADGVPKDTALVLATLAHAVVARWSCWRSGPPAPGWRGVCWN
ncbi:MAG: hypothetical protein DI543_21720 [Bradyrhizobium icense]|nr:MAG: hypothetical protein DI543_21720 [Bradyrhizobium icense]